MDNNKFYKLLTLKLAIAESFNQNIITGVSKTEGYFLSIKHTGRMHTINNHHTINDFLEKEFTTICDKYITDKANMLESTNNYLLISLDIKFSFIYFNICRHFESKEVAYKTFEATKFFDSFLDINGNLLKGESDVNIIEDDCSC